MLIHCNSLQRGGCFKTSNWYTNEESTDPKTQILHIDNKGQLKSKVNIDPIVDAMSSISKTLSTVTSTPLG